MTENYFIWVVKTSGWIGLIILICSIYFIATVARMFVELRLDTAIPPEVIAQCEALLEQRDFKGIFNVVKEDDSSSAACWSPASAELPNGLSEAREAMERVGEMIQTDMERKISIMAVLGTVGPMIGLLGTLSGMIKSFGEISRTAGTTIKADKVAGGISEALLLTFEGVGLSLPAIFAFSFFRNRILPDCGNDDDPLGRVPAALCPGRSRKPAPPPPLLEPRFKGRTRYEEGEHKCPVLFLAAKKLSRI